MSNDNLSAKEEIDQLAMTGMLADLASCTEKQREVFQRIWPKGVPSHEVPEAWNLIKRTLAGNRKASPADSTEKEGNGNG